MGRRAVAHEPQVLRQEIAGRARPRISGEAGIRVSGLGGLVGGYDVRTHTSGGGAPRWRRAAGPKI